MKKIILLMSLVAGISSCYHEDALNVPDQADKYGVLEDASTDPTRHFIYQFYQQYETVIITNPTEADYHFGQWYKNHLSRTKRGSHKRRNRLSKKIIIEFVSG